MMQLFTKLTKPMLGFALFAIASLTANAQVATNYNFNQSNGAYGSVNGTSLGVGVTTAIDDQYFVDPAVPNGGFTSTGVGFPIGFNFTYNGFTYDQFGINANGWIGLGTTAGGVDLSTSSSYVPLSGTSTAAIPNFRNRIAGLGFDLQGDATLAPAIIYRTSGAAPNRVLVVEWKDYRAYAQTGSAYNFQIRLSENGNVEVRYGVCAAVGTRTPQVGLGGVTNADFNSRTGTDWAASTAATLNTDAMTLDPALTVPTNGLAYTWTPAACQGVTSLPATAVTNSSATANWNASATAVSYNLQYRIVGTATWTAFAGNPVTGTTANLTGLSALSNYEYQVQGNCAGGLTSQFSTSINFGTACAGNSCTINFAMTDSFGDGWNGNEISVIQNGVVQGVVTLASGNAGTANITVCDAAPVQIVWTRIGSYTDEPGFVATDAGGAVLYTLVATTPQPAAVLNNVLYTGTATCPNCPVATGLVATALTATTANLGWNAPSAATSASIEYGPTGFTPGTGTVIAATANPQAITGLNAQTTYDFYVTIACGALTANASGAASFTTPCVLQPGEEPSNAIQVAAIPYSNTGNMAPCYTNTVGSPRAGVDLYYQFTPNPCASDVTVSLCAGTGFDTFLYIYDAATNVEIASNDDGCSPASTVTFTPTAGVSYYAIIEAYSTFTTVGAYSIDITETLGGPSSVLTPTVTNPSCVGASDGSVSVAATGTVTSYLWSDTNATTTAMLSNVMAGTYTVTVTNSCGGTSTASVTLVTAFNTVMTAVNAVSCNAGTNGSANITVAGAGAAPMYMWSNGAMTEDLTGVAAGVYTVTVTATAGCTSTLVATVTEPSPIDNLVLATSPLCTSSTNGMLDLMVTGGTPLMPIAGTLTTDFNSNNGSGGNMFDVDILQSTDITGFEVNLNSTAGTSKIVDVYYKTGTWNGSETNAAAWTLLGNVTVTAGGNNLPTTVTLPAPLPVSAGATYAFFVATDFGWNYIGPTGTTGVGNAWFSNPVMAIKQGIGRADNTFASGIYPGGGPASWTTQARAFSGSIIYNLPAPTPYLYAWSNAATTEDITGLSAATYTVTVTDGNACTATTSTVLNAQSMIVALSSTATIPCFGGVSPTVTISPAGGVAPYDFMWNNGNTTDTQSALMPGTYTATITDANMCTTTSSLSVTQPAAPLSMMNSNTNVLCNGSATGAILPMAMGGTAPYTFTPTMMTGLSAGTYTVIATDDNGCTTATVETITQPTMLMATATNVSNNTACSGTPTGEAMAGVTGGTPTYTYLWDNGSTDDSNTGLAAGTYTVTITDMNACNATATVTITSTVVQLIATASSTNINCFGATNGTASANTTGGVPTYTYTWSNGGNTATISNLAAGTYTAIVTDNAGCASTTSTVIAEPSAIVNTLTGTNVACFGTNSGSVMAMTSGGTAPYTYSWSNDAALTAANNPNLFAGDYYVQVTDAAGCTINSSITITQAGTGITAVATTTNQTAPNNGAVSLNIQGGVSPYMVLWSNGTATQNLTGINAGTYTATVTDANGCTQTASAVVAFIIETQSLANFSTVNLYPNPTVGPFTLNVQLASAQTVTVEIFAVTGQAIATQTKNNVTNQNFDFDLSDMPSGMYFARIKAGDETKVVKISAITK